MDVSTFYVASPLQVTPIQAETVLLILLILIAHGLGWESMVSAADEQSPA